METLRNLRDRQNPSPVQPVSPFSAGDISPPPPLTPRSASRPVDPNQFPTTFVQADSSSFKQVVQMLTGTSGSAAKISIPSPSKSTGPKKPSFKLYERRGSLRNLKAICPTVPALASAFSPRRSPDILSPSMLNLPSLVLSPITPRIPEPFNRSPPPAPSGTDNAISVEDRAIAEKGFYLHPSPRSDGEPPLLLALFPERSPRLPSSSSPDP